MNIAIATVIALTACTTETEQDKAKKTDDMDSVPEAVVSVQEGTPGAVFTNMEQVEYCLPLPLEGYSELFSDDNPRGKHVFVSKKDSNVTITVQGMFRSNPEVEAEKYFENTYSGAEEEGKIIQEKQLLKKKNCFYAKGYWSNFIYERRFIEITWLRKDEVVTLSSEFSVRDTVFWNETLKSLLNSGADCK